MQKKPNKTAIDSPRDGSRTTERSSNHHPATFCACTSFTRPKQRVRGSALLFIVLHRPPVSGRGLFAGGAKTYRNFKNPALTLLLSVGTPPGSPASTSIYRKVQTGVQNGRAKNTHTPRNPPSFSCTLYCMPIGTGLCAEGRKRLTTNPPYKNKTHPRTVCMTTRQ